MRKIAWTKELLYLWIESSPGAFCVSDLTHDSDTQLWITDRLEEMIDDGVIDRHGIRRGWYIPRNIELESMDYINADDNPVDIWLPFNLSDYVEIFESNIVIVAGAPNAGKTAILLNIIRQNEGKGWDIYYFNSEMAAGELKKRLSKFQYKSLDSWQFKAYYRNDRFSDVIFPGKNSLNIIDFLEVHDEFYVIGKRIKEIADRLKGGIAIIALQKNPGSETGLGGFRSMERARLVIALDNGRVKVSKAKNFAKADVNPNGLVKSFSLVDGCEIIDKYGWQRELKGGKNEP